MMTLAQAHTLLTRCMGLKDAAFQGPCELVGDGATQVLRVHSDTRSVQPGDLFVALKGERFDAHDFLAEARAKGAVAALAQHGLFDAGLPGLQVPNSLQALGALAQGWRAQFELPVIAVTGSNGKTTVTQMIASVLRAWLGEDALSTQGNLNNDIGVPLTLLRMRSTHRAAVVELGMNHPGEITALAALAAPTVALVNNAQREHQEFMETVEAVARENGAAIQALGAHGVAVFPADDEFTPVWRQLSGDRLQMTFALRGQADLTARVQWVPAQAEQAPHWRVSMYTPTGPAQFRLRVAGLHNVKNALAASSCALAAGCPPEAIVQGLEAFVPVKGRSALQQFQRAGQSVTLIDDTYNANPDSVRAAIDVLAALPGPRWLVLGDMGEVGNEGPAFHREVGLYARERGIETLWTAGSASVEAARAFGSDHHFDLVSDLLSALPTAPLSSAVLVKGSRFMKMEQVVQALLQGSDAAQVAGDPHAH